MKSGKLFLGILVMVLVFGFTVLGCDLLSPEEEKIGAEIINGVWYVVNNNEEKTGTVITISNGEGILTSVGNDHFGNYVNQGLINIGNPVFRNIVYIETVSDDGWPRKILYYSYDIWSIDIWDTSPDWRNNRKLSYLTKGGGNDGKSSYLFPNHHLILFLYGQYF